jgi:hypothetical protein
MDVCSSRHQPFLALYKLILCVSTARKTISLNSGLTPRPSHAKERLEAQGSLQAAAGCAADQYSTYTNSN